MKRINPQGKSSLAKSILRMLGLGPKGLGKEDCNVSSRTPVSAVAPYGPVDSLSNHSSASKQPKAFNVQAYLIGKQRMVEIESQKAMLTSLARHEKWKAGGPV